MKTEFALQEATDGRWKSLNKRKSALGYTVNIFPTISKYDEYTFTEAPIDKYTELIIHINSLFNFIRTNIISKAHTVFTSI